MNQNQASQSHPIFLHEDRNLRFDLITATGTIASRARLDEIRQIPGMEYINTQADLIKWAKNRHVKIEISESSAFDRVDAGRLLDGRLSLDPEFRQDLERRFNMANHPRADDLYDLACRASDGSYASVMENYALLAELCLTNKIPAHADQNHLAKISDCISTLRRSGQSLISEIGQHLGDLEISSRAGFESSLKSVEALITPTTAIQSSAAPLARSPRPR